MISLPFSRKYLLAISTVFVIGMIGFWNIWAHQEVRVVTTTDNKAISLPDGSVVVLRRGSELQYPEKMASRERNTLLIGEAYFDIAQNSDYPFTVNTGYAIVRVLGTRFNIKQEENTIIVTLISGKAEVRNQNSETNVTLLPGEQALVRYEDIHKKPVKDSNFLYWKTGILTFRQQPISEILDQIAAATKSDLQLDEETSKNYANQPVTIRLKGQSVEEILNNLCQLTGCEWIHNNDQYIIREK